MLADRFKICPHIRVIETKKDVASANTLPFLDHDLTNDATLKVLYRLALGVYGNHARGRHPFVEGRECQPKQEAAKPEAQYPQAKAHCMAGVGCHPTLDCKLLDRRLVFANPGANLRNSIAS